MPYVVRTSGSDSRAVSKDFDPAITMDFKRQLIGVFPLTPEGRLSIPKRLRIGRPRKGGTPHILGWSMGPWIVSSRVREIIDELEPGVQEFIPIELISKDGKRALATYFLILPPPQLDALICPQSVLQNVGATTIQALDPQKVCVLDADVIRGHHLWRGQEPLILTYFCSDELRDRLKAEKLDGWDFQHRVSERRQQFESSPCE
jgi:hypothetical protein